MAFCIQLAGKRIEIIPLNEQVRDLFNEYILPQTQQKSIDLVITIQPDDLKRENDAVKRENQRNGGNLQGYPIQLESAAIHRKIALSMIRYQAFVMHGVVIETNGLGYLITAKSGTGKSTRARLWKQYFSDSLVINGDKPLLQVTDQCIIAYGTPWCGKEGWNTNTSVPLQAIFLLERSSQGNSVHEIQFAEAFPYLIQQIYLPNDIPNRLNMLYLLRSMAGKVKIYRFQSEPTVEAIQLAWEVSRPKDLTGKVG